MDRVLVWVYRATAVMKNLAERFMWNNARNDFEQMVFDALRALIIRQEKLA